MYMSLLKLVTVESRFDCVTFTAMQDLKKNKTNTDERAKGGETDGEAKLVVLEDVLFIAADAMSCCCWPVQARQTNTATSHTHT